MKPQVKEILNELYELDSSLKQKEKELVSIISKMIESKPNVEIDSNFKSELKNKILTEIKNENNTYQKSNLFKYLLTFLSGIVALSLVIYIYPSLFLGKSDLIIPGNNDKSINLSFVPKIEKLDNENAFGKLNFKTDDQKGGVTNGKASSIMSIESNTTKASDAQINTPVKTKDLPIVENSPIIEGTGVAGKRMGLISPDYKPKRYIYNLKQGEELPKIPVSMYVYKNKNDGIKISNSNLSNMFKTDIIDFSKLQNLGLSSLSVYEDVKNGYQFDISLSEGTINIYRDYKKWAEVDYTNQKQLSKNDVPNDDNIIKIFDDFIKKYSINLDSYFKPIVNNTWRKESEKIGNDYYIPDILSVIYQFNIDGIGVYESYGTPIGLETLVNVRDMQVNSVGPIQKLNLSGSKYDLITSSGDILELAKNGAYNNVIMETSVSGGAGSSGSDINNEENTNNEFEEVQVEIGNPKLVYLRKYVYNEQTKTTEQFFVPGMMFDVLTGNDDKKMIYPGEYVAVPLVKDFADNGSNGGMKVY